MAVGYSEILIFIDYVQLYDRFESRNIITEYTSRPFTPRETTNAHQDGGGRQHYQLNLALFGGHQSHYPRRHYHSGTNRLDRSEVLD